MKPARTFGTPDVCGTSVFRDSPLTVVENNELVAKPLHPAWRAFIQYCNELQHGEIETLKIQDGLPVLAEVTRKKVKFTP